MSKLAHSNDETMRIIEKRAAREDGMTIPCTCPAYHFPHRPGGGQCNPEEQTPEDWNADENRYLTRMEWKAQQREKDLG